MVEPQNESSWFLLFLGGMVIGAFLVIVIPMVFHISPIYVDCGCGAQAEMARQCFESYATNSTDHWQCGVFK